MRIGAQRFATKRTKRLAHPNLPPPPLPRSLLPRSTVDGFQGREKDVIIFSTVRAPSEGRGGGGIGFLSDARRMNVALTRGRHCMLVLGHVGHLCQVGW